MGTTGYCWYDSETISMVLDGALEQHDAVPGAEYLRDPHPCGDEGDLQNYCPGQFTVAASRSVLGIAAFSSDLGICQT